MTELNAVNREGAMLETAPTLYVEGRGIRFAYRRLGPSTGTPLVLLQHFSGNIECVGSCRRERPSHRSPRDRI